MALLSAAIGATGSIVGVLISALFRNIALGAMIVLCGGGMFLVSLCFGTRRGLLWRLLERRKLRIETARHDLLREIYELLESRHGDESAAGAFALENVAAARSWSSAELRRLVNWAVRHGLLECSTDGMRLSERGRAEARRLVRNHRLWELYLIHYADVAPSHVDRDADLIEHVLDDEIVAELERLLRERARTMPSSPHVVGAAAAE
jgi:manganese/zinc/iron transport system permease protein